MIVSGIIYEILNNDGRYCLFYVMHYTCSQRQKQKYAHLIKAISQSSFGILAPLLTLSLPVPLGNVF